MAAAVTYDADADALTVGFCGVAVEGEEVRKNVILHFDTAERLVGIEVLHASKVLIEEAITQLQPATE